MYYVVDVIADEAVQSIHTELQGCHQRLQEIRTGSWLKALQGQDVVGMTSTFAARCVGLVRSLRPQVCGKWFGFQNGEGY